MCKVTIKPNRHYYITDAAAYLKRDGCAFFVVEKSTRIVKAVGCVHAKNYGDDYEVIKASDVTEIVIPIIAAGDWANFQDNDDDDLDSD